MEEFTTRLTSGKQIVLTVNTPCGFSLVEGAVIAASAGRYIKILLPGATSPKMDHLPVGTKVTVAMETVGGEQLACSGVINDLDERPFIWLKVTEMMPALAKRRHQRVSVNLPMFCSLLDEGGALTVIYDGKKDNGTYEPADLSLSAGGFKLKTPFKIRNETLAVVVFFSPNETEWMVPVFSKAVYSNPSPTSSSFLTGFRFSMINSRDKLKIDTLVREHLQTNSQADKIRKYPSCLLRIRNNHAKACQAEA